MHEKKEDVFPHLGEIVFLQLPLLSPTVSPAPASILERSPRLLLCCPDTGPGTSAAHGDRSPGNSVAGAAVEAKTRRKAEVMLTVHSGNAYTTLQRLFALASGLEKHDTSTF